jgi:hypothetical protein
MYSAPPPGQPPALTLRQQRQFWILVTTLLAVLCMIIVGVDAWPKRHYPNVVWTFGVLATIYSLLLIIRILVAWALPERCSLSLHMMLTVVYWCLTVPLIAWIGFGLLYADGIPS